MALLWARLDVNIGSHDKMLNLLADPSAKRWQAYASYVTAIGWSVGHGTNGRIPIAALPFVHGTTSTARLLTKHDLWIEHPAAWEIKNFGEYQVLTEVDERTVAGKKKGAAKANCRRWHGPDCGCWEVVGCVIRQATRSSESDYRLPHTHARTDRDIYSPMRINFR